MKEIENPVADYFETKKAAKTERKQHEIKLWTNWKENGEQPHHLQPLLKLYEPVIASKVRFGKPKAVPEPVYKAELQSRAIKAFQTYDPERGAALNTHVDWHLRKALRYGNRYANVGYLPEEQARLIGPINRATDALTEEFGREPTPTEIHAHMQQNPDKDFRKLTVKRIETVMAGNFKDIPMSHSAGPDAYDYTAGSEPTHHLFEDQQIAVAKNILPTIFPNNPVMHELFHHTFGTDGRVKIMSTGQLAKKLGKTPPQISRMKTQMGEMLRKQMGLDEDED